MATTTTDLIAASRALDPAGRALLNLWLHRGLDDAAIANLAGGSAADVAERRRLVVERLATEVGDTPEAVRAALDDLAVRPASGRAPSPRAVTPAQAPVEPPELILPGEARATAGPADLVVPGQAEAIADPADLIVPGGAEEPAAPADIVVPGETEAPAEPRELVVPADVGAPPSDPKPPDPEPEPAVARRSPIPATLGVALGLVIAGTVLAAGLSGGGGSESGGGSPSPTPTATATATATPTPAAPRPQRLAAVPGGPDAVEGTLAVEGRTVRLDVDGLDRPPGDYEVWLYNSLSDARPLGKLTAAEFRLPSAASRFAYLDVSLEGDSNRNHSGRSVLRARLPR